MPASDEDRILRFWTPILLRSILVAASIILVLGLVLSASYTPDYYVGRYYAVRAGHLHARESFARMFVGAAQGQPHSVMTIGLFVLTLVPLARVAFCFLLFLRERDYAYVGFTAYVLAGLVLGVMLGKIG
ncbi:MAG TPA: DUF1634 domain-containing protein [Candidatus Binataceae bacterium]|nr:DUF1634 domain-containing protein [Candidatus Binataceae bacterium]